MFNGADVNLGASFAVAVIASILAAVDAGVIFKLEAFAGDGPFYACVNTRLVTSNTDIENPPTQPAEAPVAEAAGVNPSLAIGGTATSTPSVADDLPVA